LVGTSGFGVVVVDVVNVFCSEAPEFKAGPEPEFTD
jgi:hypothetical protein